MAQVDWIVVHYTANLGDTAQNNAEYFAREVLRRKASAHFFVDEREVWSSVPIYRIAYHCGGGLQGAGGHTHHQKCTNTNSIGVEICMTERNACIRHGAIRHAAELVRWLMDRYGVDIDHVIRHYDVTGKNCPAPMVQDGGLWKRFLNMVTEQGDEMTQDQFDALHGKADSAKAAKSPSAWATEAWKKATEAGIVDGSAPQSPLTREQFCVILGRLGLLGK